MATVSMEEGKRPLSVVTKLAYGTGDLGPAMVSMIKGFFLLNFLINIAGIPPIRAGAILLIGRIWDAVNDPIVGTLTDRTRTRWGRRRPWLLFGSVPFGLAFFLHFLVPSGMSETGLFFYYVIVGIFLDAGFTAVNVPYTALTPELSESNQDRTDLNMYRFSFSVLGGLVAAVLYNVIVNQFFVDDPKTGNMIQGIIIALVIVISNVIVFLNTTEKETDDDENEENMPFFEGLKTALQSRPFLHVATIYLLTWLALQFVQSLILFYYRDYIGGDPGGGFTILLFSLQFSIFVFIVVWGFVSRRIGRKNSFYLGIPVWILCLVGLYFVQPGQTTAVTILAVVSGIGVSLGFLIPWSLLPDVVDDDELKTGQRREGIFYGFFVFLQKLGISIGLFVQGVVLDWAGYQEAVNGVAQAQPESALLAIRLLITIAPIILLVLSIFVVYRNPIDQKRLAEIQRMLAERRKQIHFG